MKKEKYVGTWSTNNGNTYGHLIYSNNRIKLMTELRSIVKGNISSNTDNWTYSIYTNDNPIDMNPCDQQYLNHRSGQGYIY